MGFVDYSETKIIYHSTKMNKRSNVISVEIIRQNLVQHDLQVKALIQDIVGCKESLEGLNLLNCQGRGHIDELRKDIELLEQYARDNMDKKLSAEVESHRQQLASSLHAFKNANVASAFAIEKAQKEELLGYKAGDGEIRQRKKTDKSSLLKVSSGVTDQLLSISRQLADTTQRSAETLDTLATSSSGVQNTRDELENTAGTINQSGKLLKKYSRREFTDKIVIFFSFLFFIACVLYILHKRLF